MHSSLQLITCAALSQHFVVTGSRNGALSYYLADNLAPVNDFKNPGEALKEDDTPLKRMTPP
jgi:hypothetical protein